MSILIQGMEIPKGNNEAIVITSDGKATIVHGGMIVVRGGYATSSSKAIELEPHGRLIDADAVVNQLKAVAPNGSSGWVYYNGLCQIIKITPTIIEADMGVE